MKAKVAGIFLSLLMGSAVAAGPVNKMVVFGDSLSDNGNLYEYMRHQLPLSPPYHQGRFTNGPVWIEYVAQHYFPENHKTRLIDYAFGGSSIGGEEDDDDLDDGAMLSLKSEMDSYFLSHADKAEPNALYVVWMGSNNYLALPEKERLDEELNIALSGLKEALARLAEKGAKQVMVVGLPDLGLIPMAREFDAVEDLSYLANTHNKLLREEVNRLQASRPDMKWVYFEVNDVFVDALTYPERYGFKETKKTCYDTLEYAPSAHGILSMAARVKPRFKSEKNPCDTYLFFDPVHPSGRGHKHIGRVGVEALDAAGILFE